MSRAALATIVVAALVGSLATAALAWDLGCDGGQACVWKNPGFVVPHAAHTGGDNDYRGNVYPNTIDTINDSVSSIRNRYGTSDVVWFFDPSYNGWSFCLNPGWQSGQLNGHDNQYSSHLIALSTTC